MRISDWSSDVCSSDLPAEEPLSGARAMLDDGLFKRFPKPDFGFAAHVTNLPAGVVAIKAGPSSSASDSRSEERRVGTECVSTCRSRRSQYPSKKKQLRIHTHTHTQIINHTKI